VFPGASSIPMRRWGVSAGSGGSGAAAGGPQLLRQSFRFTVPERRLNKNWDRGRAVLV